jgi:hypothetical protein
MLRALDKFLVQGLGAIPEQTAQDLSRFLRKNGLGKAAVRARALQDPAPERRYRAFVELRLALEEAVVKLFRPEAIAPFSGRMPSTQASSVDLQTPAELIDAARCFETTPAALRYLHSDPNLSGLAAQEVETLLGNDDLRLLAAQCLTKAPREQLLRWLRAMVQSSNGLARRSCYLLAQALSSEEAARETLMSWSHPEDQDAAFEFFHPRRMESRPGLLCALDPETPVAPEARRFALRMVARSAREKEPDQWAPLLEEDPELQALLKIARFKAGEVPLEQVRSWASSLDSPELRACATVQCWIEGDCDPRVFLQEIHRNREHLPLLLSPLRNSSKLESHLKDWKATLDLSRPTSERERALEELLASGDRRLANHLLGHLSDPTPGFRDRLFPYLCGALGLLPVRITVDLSPLATTPFEEFSSDILHGFERILLPSLAQVPDIRTAPYLGYLLRRFGPEAVPPEVLHTMGPALLPELEILLDNRDKRLQVLALQELESLCPDPRAQNILRTHQSGQDPLETAVERLLIDSLREAAQSQLESLDRTQSVPHLLEIARNRKEVREPILEVLTSWKSEAALPFLSRLLGSPLPEMVRGKPGNRETRWLTKCVSGYFLRYGDSACQTLETSLRNSENWTVRHHAAHLLGELATESTTPTLSMALEEEGVEEVRNQIIHSLGCTGGSQAVDALEPLIRSSLPADQARAARALGEISLPEAHSLLKELLESTEDLSLKRLLRGQLHSQEGS